MHLLKSLAVISAVALLVACGSSPQQKKDTAEARLTEENTKTIKEYKECVEKAKQDTAKLNACEYIMKAVQPAAAPAQ
jgi:hypothetical protein